MSEQATKVDATTNATESSHEDRSKTQVALESLFKRRNSSDQLQQVNIIRGGADSLAASRVKLQTEMTKDKVSRALGHRPEIADLEEAHIVEGQQVAPRLQSMAKQLDRSLKADNLNRKLFARNLESVKSLGVLPADDVAPSIRAATLALAHAMTRDQVSHLLEMRPDQYDLVKANILPASSSSSRIQAVQRQLRHNMTVDRVGQLLFKRAEVNELQNAGVLRDVRIAPRLQGVQHQLERNIARSNLLHALNRRPTKTELEQKQIYIPIEGDKEGEWERLGGEGQAEQINVGQSNQSSNQRHQPFQQLYQQQQGVQKQQLFTQQSRTSAPSDTAGDSGYEPVGYQRRSKNFHLTRILLKVVAQMAEAGELSLPHKGVLKDLIVDQDPNILAVCEHFDAENDIVELKGSLIRIAQRR